MATTYDIQGALVRLNLSGEYSMEDIKHTLAEALDDSACPEKAFVLMDLTESQSLSKRSADDVRSMAKYLAGVSDRFDARMAIVASSRLHYGMMRMAEVYAESSGMSVRVFLSMGEALDWLDVDGSD